MKKIKIYSFFSGCGLLDLGLEQAGFDISFVSEKYFPFLNAYMFSRLKLEMGEPEHGYHNDDLNDYLSGNVKIDNFVKTDRESSFIGFVGGPPCPDFSTAGKNKGISGDNGILTEKYFELICKESPDFFIFENVKGLWKTKKHKKFYDEMFSKMKNHNYYILDKLTNSLEYGVPQERERIIMIGIKFRDYKEKIILKDLLKDFSWGVKDANVLGMIKNMRWPTTSAFVEDSHTYIPDDIMEEVTVQYWFEKNNVDYHPNAINFFKPKAGLDRMKIIQEGDVSRKSYKRLHRWRYSPTAAYGNNEVHLHPYKIRRLSVAEVLAIQSAPPEFELPINMSLTDMFKTVGNGVPVLMARKIGEELISVLKVFLDKTRGDK